MVKTIGLFVRGNVGFDEPGLFAVLDIHERFLDALETVYAASARVALEVLGSLGGRHDEAPAKRDKNRVV